MRTWFCIILLLAVSLPRVLNAQVTDAEVEKARKAVGSKVIRCSGEGKIEGTVNVAQALGQLKTGMELVLLPGLYSEPMEINADGVIISGEGTKYCHCYLKISGKNCTVRNLWLKEIHLIKSGSVIVVDSVMHGAWVMDETTSDKVRLGLFNNCIQGVICGGQNSVTRVDIKNCTIIDDKNGNDKPGPTLGPFSENMMVCYTKAEVNIENSILYSNRILFAIKNEKKKLPKLTLRNNLLFSDAGIGTISFPESAKKDDNAPTVSYDINTFCKQGKFTMAGENISQKPKLISLPIPLIKFPSGRTFQPQSVNAATRRPKCFVLAQDSPGQGKGIIIDEHPYVKYSESSVPQPIEENQETIDNTKSIKAPMPN